MTINRNSEERDRYNKLCTTISDRHAGKEKEFLKDCAMSGILQKPYIDAMDELKSLNRFEQQCENKVLRELLTTFCMQLIELENKGVITINYDQE